LRYAKAELALSQDQGGQTVREHLEAVEIATGRTIEELHPDPPPDETAHLWEWFCELCSARGSNGFGPNPLAYSEIAAWAALTGANPDPFDVAVLKRLDSAFLASAAKSAKSKTDKKPAGDGPPTASQPRRKT
jgi:hypothetical protein